MNLWAEYGLLTLKGDDAVCQPGFAWEQHCSVVVLWVWAQVSNPEAQAECVAVSEAAGWCCGRRNLLWISFFYSASEVY